MQRAAQVYGKVANQTANQRELEASLLLRAASRLQAVHDGWDRKQDELGDALLYNRRLWTIFMAAVAQGDKRIILVDGEAKGVINRVPSGDDIRSNMVRGGAAKETDLTERERAICSTIGPELRKRGLLFVGIDVIDGYLTEINVTSPTGIRAVKRLGGPDLAVAIWDAIEAKLTRK